MNRITHAAAIGLPAWKGETVETGNYLGKMNLKSRRSSVAIDNRRHGKVKAGDLFREHHSSVMGLNSMPSPTCSSVTVDGPGNFNFFVFVASFRILPVITLRLRVP